MSDPDHAPLADEVSAFARLRDALGPTLVAILAGATTIDVGAWVAGDATPPPSTRALLHEVASLVDELLEVDDARVVRAWFMGMNPQLDDYSPAEAIADGRIREAAAATQAFIQGG